MIPGYLPLQNVNGCDISPMSPWSVALRDYNDVYVWSGDRGCDGQGCQITVEEVLTQWEPCTVPIEEVQGEAVAFGNPELLYTVSEGSHAPISKIVL